MILRNLLFQIRHLHHLLLLLVLDCVGEGVEQDVLFLHLHLWLFSHLLLDLDVLNLIFFLYIFILFFVLFNFTEVALTNKARQHIWFYFNWKLLLFIFLYPMVQWLYKDIKEAARNPGLIISSLYFIKRGPSSKVDYRRNKN